MISGYPPLRLQQHVPLVLAWIAVFVYTLAVVALFASGRLFVAQAGIMLSVPAVLAVALLRPEWIILVLVALPPFVASVIPPMQLVALLLVALFGFLLQGGLRLGPRTGIFPLAAIIILALAMPADVSADAAAIADGFLKNIVFYVVLMLVAFHAISTHRLHVDTFVNALLIGLVLAVFLEPFFGETTGFVGITYTPYRGQFAYLAVMGFGVTYIRRSLTDPAHRARADAVLMVVFLCLAAIGFGRAAWIAGLWVFALAALWARKRAFWIATAAFLILVLMVPVVGERVLPTGTTGLGDPEALVRVTTGRSELWAELWRRGATAAPFGQGWGYIPSLDGLELFGVEGEFQAGGNPFVFPHNDFLYLFVELGIPGLALLAVFWLVLQRKIRTVSRGDDPEARYGVRVLTPIVITMFVVQLFDNGFAIRFVAIRFFSAAGIIFALAYPRRLPRHWAVGHARSLDTTRGSSLPDA